MKFKKLSDLHEEKAAKIITFAGKCRTCQTDAQLISEMDYDGRFETRGDAWVITTPRTGWVIFCADCGIPKNFVEEQTETEVYSRVVGYLRPVKNWHDSKKAEYENRVNFKLE